jgi:CheY-like chemotaxis protein
LGLQFDLLLTFVIAVFEARPHNGQASMLAAQRKNARARWSEDKPMTQVLVAEDEGAISIALEDALTDGGYTVAGPFSSHATALAWLQDNTPDLALLDLLLTDGPCTELARTLQHRGVPVLFLSGDQPRNLPADLQDLRWIDKPVSFEDLMGALRSLPDLKWSGAPVSSRK